MRNRMISQLLIFFLTLIVLSGVIFCLINYRASYKAVNLLRVDPLETGRLRSENTQHPQAGEGIWMLGDSRIARWDTRLLDTDLPISNLGLEGQTSSQIYYRLKGYLETDTPQIIILEVGINDLKVVGIDNAMASPITANLIHNIEEIKQICLEKDITLILLNVFPVGKIEFARRFVWNKTVEEAILTVNKALMGFCDDNRILYFDAYNLLSHDGNSVNPEFRDDFMHINKKGYEILSVKMKDLIKKITNKKQ